MRMDRRGKRRFAFPKGRVLEDAALDEVKELVGEERPQRDLLIECLHCIQDHIGFLHARHIKALATHMALSQAEVYEVARFYHHFTLVKEEDTPPPPVVLRVCDGLSCQLNGAEALLKSALEDIDPALVRIERAPCMGACDKAPAVLFGKRLIAPADDYAIGAAVADGATAPHIPTYRSLDAYLEDGGYGLLRAVRAGDISGDTIITLLSDAGLKGLGGAGFPAGRKWQIVRSYQGPRLMTINADEGEPGTFKDRYFLSHDPHRMLEGALIAAHVVEAEAVYLYLRDEYPELHVVLAREIAKLVEAGLLKEDFFHLRRGAGAYICGEESAMIESIEGKRGLPRQRPPYIAEEGLFGRPTLNHNVETLYWVRDIVENGADWFVRQGLEGHPGFRSFSVSGRVRQPGVVIAPAGISVRQLIEDHCGGMQEGHQLKAFLPGGASGGVLPASLADLPLDFGTLSEHGAFVGSHAVIVLSDQDNVADVVRGLVAFFKSESCGQCTPCRCGTEKLEALLEKDNLDEALIADLIAVMRDASICGLGQAAPNPVAHLLRHFREDLA